MKDLGVRWFENRRVSSSRESVTLCRPRGFLRPRQNLYLAWTQWFQSQQASIRPLPDRRDGDSKASDRPCFCTRTQTRMLPSHLFGRVLAVTCLCQSCQLRPRGQLVRETVSPVTPRERSSLVARGTVGPAHSRKTPSSVRPRGSRLAPPINDHATARHLRRLEPSEPVAFHYSQLLSCRGWHRGDAGWTVTARSDSRTELRAARAVLLRTLQSSRTRVRDVVPLR